MQSPYDETADVLFRRGREKPISTGLRMFDNDLPGGLKYGEIVELFGQANVGKTELLYQIIATCILPWRWRDIDIGGNNSGAVYFDNDYHFCMTRLVAVLESKIRSAYSTHPASQSAPLAVGDIQDIVLASLRRLYLFKCRDNLQFLASLQSLQVLLDKETNIKLLVIDSISAFHWLNRIEEKDGTRYQRQVSHALKRLTNSYSLLVFATKGPLSAPKEKDKDGVMVHTEYLSNWDIVKYRLVLAPQANKKFIAKFASPIAQTTSLSTANNTTTITATLPQQTPTINTSGIYKYLIDETGLHFL